MKDNKCVSCGVIIPEGRQVCPNCDSRKMKDKEKQIEEINCKDCIHHEICTDKISCGVLTADKDGYLKLKCKYYQPKIPKDSVVLSREEYEKLTKELVTEQRAKEIAQEYFGIVRKETAEKILTIIGNMIDECDDRFKLKDYQWHKDLCRQFGVEIKENYYGRNIKSK